MGYDVHHFLLDLPYFFIGRFFLVTEVSQEDREDQSQAARNLR